MPNSPRLSLCMIVKNEESCLRRCLENVRPVVDEIVIVDTGSTDNTREIARSYADVLLDHTWQNDFSLARNESLAHASGDWILVLDADELLDEAAKPELRAFLTSTTADGISLIVRNIQPADSLVAFTDILITRLFRNRPDIRYTGSIHEQIKPAILANAAANALPGGEAIVETNWVILHDGYAQRTVQGSVSRAERNLSILKQALVQSPRDAYLHYQIGVTYRAMGHNTLAREWLQKALTLDAFSLGDEILSTLYMKLAQIASAESDYALAARHAQSSLKHDPENTISQYLLALSHIFQGNVQRAYPVFVQLRQNPTLNLKSLTDLDQVIEYCETIINKPNRN